MQIELWRGLKENYQEEEEHLGKTSQRKRKYCLVILANSTENTRLEARKIEKTKQSEKKRINCHAMLEKAIKHKNLEARQDRKHTSKMDTIFLHYKTSVIYTCIFNHGIRHNTSIIIFH